MAVTETTRTSWITRLGDSFKGVLTGLAMFIAAFPLLFWNEGRAVATAKALAEGESNVVSLPSAAVDQANEGKLIHFTGKAETQDVLTDSIFGISLTGIRLERSVEMYQWAEKTSTHKQKKLGGAEETVTTYSYSKVWASGLIDSSGFKEPGHDNPTQILVPEDRYYAQNVTVGGFTLDESQIKRIGHSEKYVIPAELKDAEIPGMTVIRMAGNSGYYLTAAQVSAPAATAVVQAVAGSNTVAAAASAVTNAAAAVASNVVAAVAGAVPAVPAVAKIGDIKVTFSVVLPHDISIVGVQTGNKITSYVAANGKTVYLQNDGTRSAQEMFTSAKQSNKMLTWILRFVGFMLMYWGLSAVFKPLSVIGDVIPFVGTIIGMGTGLVAGLISAICTLITIAIAWLFYRPVIGVILLAVAGALIVLFIQKKKAAKAAAKPEETQPTPAA